MSSAINRLRPPPTAAPAAPLLHLPLAAQRLAPPTVMTGVRWSGTMWASSPTKCIDGGCRGGHWPSVPQVEIVQADERCSPLQRIEITGQQIGIWVQKGELPGFSAAPFGVGENQTDLRRLRIRPMPRMDARVRAVSRTTGVSSPVPGLEAAFSWPRQMTILGLPFGLETMSSGTSL